MSESRKDDVLQMLECYKSCTATIGACLEMGGEHADPDHINLLLDCAQICNLTADFAIRESPNLEKLSGLCAEICEKCAEECNALAGDNDEMQRCAEACQSCAETCRRMRISS